MGSTSRRINLVFAADKTVNWSQWAESGAQETTELCKYREGFAGRWGNRRIEEED